MIIILKYVPVSSVQNIYIEANGEKLAVVESYKCRAVRETRSVGEIGSSGSAAYVNGLISFYIELKRVLLNGEYSDPIDFYSLTDFNLVISKPGRRVIYSGCEWTDLIESGSVNGNIIESVTITAAKRTV